VAFIALSLELVADLAVQVFLIVLNGYQEVRLDLQAAL
jgi:hypothetical protein